VKITGIASAHLSSTPMEPKGGSNYIYLIEMGGLRLAHFGDIGQEALTPEQLAALGKIDIAMTQFANSYSDMSASNQKGFNLMKQVAPRLIIPTHNDLDAAQFGATLWSGLYTEKPSVTIHASDLSEQTQVFYIGGLVKSYANILKLIKVDW
jgi:L-ascorbate metabolism protein UlaG (beta-lactamase superfamily)